jgi:hypothetical protein
MTFFRRGDSLSLVQAFLFSLGVSGGDISLFRGSSKSMKADELLLSAKNFPQESQNSYLTLTNNPLPYGCGYVGYNIYGFV